MKIDWAEVRRQLDGDLDKNTAVLSKLLKDVIPKALKAEGFDADLGATTDRLIAEVAHRTQLDLQKLRLYQEDDVDPHKLVAYVCFWIRKLKPIPVYPRTGKAVLDINERLSLWMMSAMTTRLVQHGAIVAPDLATKLTKFFANQDFFDYVVHGLRYRTFGPHHYTAMVKLVAES